MKDSTVKGAGFSQNSLITNTEAGHKPLDSRWNRRTFLTGMGLGTGAFLLSPLRLPVALAGDAEDLMLCVGSFGAGDAGTLHTLRVRNGKVRVLYSTPSARPAAIAMNPFRLLLYIANDVSGYEHRPRGTIDTFAVDPITGELKRTGRQPLSLSATRPRSLALSPDGQRLLVAAFGGGAYNVLPIDQSGLPGAPICVLKQVGHGQDITEQASAHPSQVLFHPKADFAVATDYGADRLDFLLRDEGESYSGRIKVTARIPFTAGSGPEKIASHRKGRLLVASQRLRPALTAFHVTSENRIVPVGEIALNTAPAAICFHPERDLLYSAQKQSVGQASVAAWRVNPQKGITRQVGEITLPGSHVSAMYSTDAMLWVASDRGLMAAELDNETGLPHTAHIAAAIPSICSLVALRQS